MSKVHSIVLIEDSPSDILLMRMALDGSGIRYELREIADGRSVLPTLKNALAAPDLIVTDMVVPGLDFDEFLAVIKNTPSLQDVPLVVMSGMRDSGVLRRMKTNRVTDYLMKPANLAGWRKIGEQLKHMLEGTWSAESGA